jgi:hypothetical protein
MIFYILHSRVVSFLSAYLEVPDFNFWPGDWLSYMKISIVSLKFVYFLWLCSPARAMASSFHEVFVITRNDAPQSLGLLWANDQLVAVTSSWQHTTYKTDKHPCPGGIRIYDYSRWATVGLRLRPRGHWDLLVSLRHSRQMPRQHYMLGCDRLFPFNTYKCTKRDTTLLSWILFQELYIFRAFTMFII